MDKGFGHCINFFKFYIPFSFENVSIVICVVECVVTSYDLIVSLFGSAKPVNLGGVQMPRKCHMLSLVSFSAAYLHVADV